MDNADNVIQRLTASKLRHEDEVRRIGCEMGKRWAERSAEFHQLKRLSDARDPVNDWYLDSGQTGLEADKELFYLILSEFGPDAGYGVREAEAEAAEFWDVAIGDGHEHLLTETAFVQGFAEGAMEVYNVVLDQI